MIAGAWLIGLFAALLVAVLALQLVPAPPVPEHAYLIGRGLSEARPVLPWWRTVLLPFEWLARYLPHNIVRQTQYTLYWAHQDGRWLAWDAPSFLALKLAGAVAGLALAVLSGQPPQYALIIGVLGWWLPGLFVNGKSRRYREAVRGEIPDLVGLLSMLVQAGKSTPQALQEIARMDSPLAHWLEQGLAAATGRDLLTVLKERAAESGLADLISLTSQLQYIEGTGAGMADLLDALARDLAVTNKFNKLRQAAQITSQIIFPVLLFYFVPYLGVILFPMAFRAMGLLTGF